MKTLFSRFSSSLERLQAVAETIPGPLFFASPRGEHTWSIAQEVLHTAFCIVPIHQALRSPKLVIRRWGQARGSRSEADFLKAYRAATSHKPWRTIAPFIPREASDPESAVKRYGAADPTVISEFLALTGSKVSEISQSPMLDETTTRDQVTGFLDEQRTVALERMAPIQDGQLDSLRLPLPYMGLITLREMLYFTVMHTDHHRQRIELKRDARM